MSHSDAWFPCYVNDLLGSMRWKMMTPAQRGAYWQLICWQMQSDDGHLTPDVKALSRLADLDLEADGALVLEAFPMNGNGRRANPRALAEWRKRQVISGKRSASGKAGMAKRWQKDNTAIASVTTTTTTTTTTPTVTPTPTAKDTPLHPPKGGVALPFESQAFKEIWGAYIEHRRKLRKPMTDTAQSLALRKLPKSEAEAIRWVENAIEKGWQGIYEPSSRNGSTYTPVTPSPAKVYRD